MTLGDSESGKALVIPFPACLTRVENTRIVYRAHSVR
jgi:hypothetical protein